MSAAVHLPLADSADAEVATAAAAARADDGGLPGWVIGVFGGVAFVLAVALGFGLRHLTSRSSSRKAVSA